MYEMTDGYRRGDDREDILHFKAPQVGVEGHAYGMLHPAVGYKDPEGRKVGTNGYHPSGKKMEFFRHPVPAEKHYREKGGFNEKSKKHLDSKRGTENIPTIQE